MPIRLPSAGLLDRSAPTSVLDHVLTIDQLLRAPAVLTEASASDPDAGSPGMAVGAVPWQHGGPWAATHDTDGDGIPDAFDYYFGPGAFPIGT